MKKKDIECYRINYDKAGWEIVIARGGVLPPGILDAVHALCDEVERLRGWKPSPRRGGGR